LDFFQILGLSEVSFLQTNPDKGDKDEHHRNNRKIAKSVSVVIDMAEFGVSLKL
jgi:hypothetical protein